MLCFAGLSSLKSARMVFGILRAVHDGEQQMESLVNSCWYMASYLHVCPLPGFSLGNQCRCASIACPLVPPPLPPSAVVHRQRCMDGAHDLVSVFILSRLYVCYNKCGKRLFVCCWVFTTQTKPKPPSLWSAGSTLRQRATVTTARRYTARNQPRTRATQLVVSARRTL